MTMKMKLFAIWTALLIAVLTFSPVYAGKVSVTPGLGSLVITVEVTGAGKDPTATLSNVTGIPLAYCFNSGNDNGPVPGQSPSEATAQDITEALVKLDNHNGKFTVNLEDDLDWDSLSWIDFGCPNNNWDAVPYFVKWTGFTLTITNSNGDWFDQHFTCDTKYDPVNYFSDDGNTFNDGSITCWEG